MQYRIIRVLNGIVSFASSDGTFFNVPIEELDFEPKVGDEVQCFRNGEKMIVVLKNHRQTSKSVRCEPNGKHQSIMSHKIIRVLNGVVSIASSEGAFFNVSIEELDFEPKVGDEVQCFRKGENVIVFKNNLNPHSKNTVSKNESQGIVQNTPIDNPFSEDAVEKKSKTPWIIGIILLLLVILLGGVYLNYSRTMTDPRDGKKYKTVQIGKQIWMAENLNYRTKNESWCVDNKESNCDKYGRLYTWRAAMSACPSGWHLPSKNEFEILINEVGGIDIAGKMLKSKKEWMENGNGVDAFSFSALPAGVWDSRSGRFLLDGRFTLFWSSSENSRRAYNMSLVYNYDNVFIRDYDKFHRFSVRCLHD